MSATISNTDFQSDIKSFKDVAQTTQLHSSIFGIAVNGTGLPIDGIDFAERSANLLSVRNLEEQERDRRVAEDSDYQQRDFSNQLKFRKLSSALEEAERSRRIADADGSEEYRALLARKVTASISSDILSQSTKLRQAARNAIDNAKLAGQDMLQSASGFASRAVQFLGQKATALGERANEKVQQLTGKAALQAQNLKDQAQDQVELIGAKAFLAAHGAGEKAVLFGTQTYGDAVHMIAIGKLNFAEETERAWRTTVGLNAERFLLAMKTSALVRESLTAKGQYDGEFNSWYGTGILEEFERKRRTIDDKDDNSSKTNAKKSAQAVHLSNIQTQSYKPQLKQLEKVSATIGKIAEEIHAAPVRAAAAM